MCIDNVPELHGGVDREARLEIESLCGHICGRGKKEIGFMTLT